MLVLLLPGSQLRKLQLLLQRLQLHPHQLDHFLDRFSWPRIQWVLLRILFIVHTVHFELGPLLWDIALPQWQGQSFVRLLHFPLVISVFLYLLQGRRLLRQDAPIGTSFSTPSTSSQAPSASPALQVLSRQVKLASHPVLR